MHYLTRLDYIHANHTHKIIYYLAEALDCTAKFEHSNFDLAFLDSDENAAMLMEDEDNSLNFRREELPKLVDAEASLRVGVTYDKKVEEREKIVQNTMEALEKKKTDGLFLLILGYIYDTKPEDPYMRLDGFLFDGDGKLLWKNVDNQNRKTNFRGV